MPTGCSQMPTACRTNPMYTTSSVGKATAKNRGTVEHLLPFDRTAQALKAAMAANVRTTVTGPFDH